MVISHLPLSVSRATSTTEPGTISRATWIACCAAGAAMSTGTSSSSGAAQASRAVELRVAGLELVLRVPRRRGRARVVLPGPRVSRLAEGWRSGGGLVEDRAQPPDVRRRPQLVAAGLLGREVAPGAHAGPVAPGRPRQGEVD